MPQITPYRLTLVLAYCAYYTPKFLSGRCLAATHLRRLSAWLNHPVPTIRSARQHPMLALHLAVAQGCQLVSCDSGTWRVTQLGMEWVAADNLTQLEYLVKQLQDDMIWQETLAKLNLTDTLGLDNRTYALQQLERQRTENHSAGIAKWRHLPDEDWRLDLPEDLPLLTLFHLLQMGSWLSEDRPGQEWLATQYSIARAAQSGYGINQIEYTLINATGEPLPENIRKQLAVWYAVHDSYEVKPVYLLSVKQPEQLLPVLTHGLMKRQVQEQIGRRHAIVSPGIIPGLRNWLAKQDIPLAESETKSENVDIDAGTVWLALEVLRGLQKMLPLALPPMRVGNVQEDLEAEIGDIVQAEMEVRATQILTAVKQAIRGKDAFFPAIHTNAETILEMITTAMNTDQLLDITYRGLVDVEPYLRRIEPLRLEQWHQLHYLHAYCYRAEANRVFRVDRIKDCQLVEESAYDKRLIRD